MGQIRVGIGGWDFAPWRETFYPPAMRKADALDFASRALRTIEINATFYRTQNEATFHAWREAVPEGFVFSVKAPRAATYTVDPAKAASSVERFLGSGVRELGAALGPILWQFAPTRRFDEQSMAAFLGLLPSDLKHAVEMRHPTAEDPRLTELLREHQVALAGVERPGEAMREERTAPFSYVRIETTVDEEANGLGAPELREWAERLRGLATAGDVFAYVISGAKHRNPAAAQALQGLCP